MCACQPYVSFSAALHWHATITLERHVRCVYTILTLNSPSFSPQEALCCLEVEHYLREEVNMSLKSIRQVWGWGGGGREGKEWMGKWREREKRSGVGRKARERWSYEHYCLASTSRSLLQLMLWYVMSPTLKGQAVNWLPTSRLGMSKYELAGIFWVWSIVLNVIAPED